MGVAGDLLTLVFFFVDFDATVSLVRTDRYPLNSNKKYVLLGTNRLFMCQDENENEPEDESFRSFWIKPVTNKPGFSTIMH